MLFLRMSLLRKGPSRACLPLTIKQLMAVMHANHVIPSKSGRKESKGNLASIVLARALYIFCVNADDPVISYDHVTITKPDKEVIFQDVGKLY